MRQMKNKSESYAPKKLVSLPAINRLLLRHIDAPPNGPTPEQHLIVAVICRAIGDARSGKQEARNFFIDGRLNQWCELVDLNPNFVIEVAKKTNFLLPEKLL
jgi:hypothetical protein